MKGNILIVEDVADLADVVARYLAKEGFEVKAVTSAEDVFALLDTWECGLIMDINLPGMDGFEFLTRFKKTGDTPVLIMSARTSEKDQISGLGIGADEYITKPFSPRVLTARVRSLFRRMEGLADRETRRLFHFGPYTLDMDTRTLKKDSALTAGQFRRQTPTTRQGRVFVLRFLTQRKDNSLYMFSHAVKPRMGKVERFH